MHVGVIYIVFMNKFLNLFCIACLSIVGYAQKNVNSPYSYYGLGETRFAGNTENNLMGGISAWVDSTRVDVRNPASLGKLILTTYSVGFATNFRTMKTQTNSSKTQVSTIDYLALSFPVSPKVGLSVGLKPYSSIGYKVGFEKNEAVQYFEGNGGINQMYLAGGYEPIKGLRFGLSAYYNFGKRDIENLYKKNNEPYTIQDKTESTYRGFSFTLGAQYEYELTNTLTLSTSLAYTPKVRLDTQNKRYLATVQYIASSVTPLVKDQQEIALDHLDTSDLIIPNQLTFGAGIGNKQKWFVGVDYATVSNQNFQKILINSQDVQYKNAYKLSIGGFYLPNYNSFTSYWERVTYRLGAYYENTGISIKNELIKDFGISFGVSLPVKGISNITIGALYGSKGTQNKYLIKENYVGLKFALTLNDRWFQKSKYN